MTTSPAADGRAPVDHLGGVEVRVDEPVGADGGRPHLGVAHGLAGVVDQLGVALDAPLGGLHAVDTRDGVDERGVEAGALVAQLVAGGGDVAADVDVGALVGSAKSPSKVLPMVSVSTSVPAMKATPRRTARLVVRSRSLRAARFLRVVLNMVITLRSASCGRARARPWGADISSTIRPSARNTTRLGVGGGDGVVGDHHDGLAQLARPPGA